jgi:hypothetical protein
MKKFMFLTGLLMFVSLFVFAGNLPTDSISFGRAWSHCLGTTSYLVWLVLGVGVSAFGGWKLWKDYDKNQSWTVGHQLAVFAILIILALSILYRPSEIAANTTNEQADRGVFIGY